MGKKHVDGGRNDPKMGASYFKSRSMHPKYSAYNWAIVHKAGSQMVHMDYILTFSWYNESQKPVLLHHLQSWNTSAQWDNISEEVIRRPPHPLQEWPALSNTWEYSLEMQYRWNGFNILPQQTIISILHRGSARNLIGFLAERQILLPRGHGQA